MRSEFNLPAHVVERANGTRLLLREVVTTLRPAHVLSGHWHQRLTHELQHPDGQLTRVDVLGMENNPAGNGVLIWPGDNRLRIEPLLIKGR